MGNTVLRATQTQVKFAYPLHTQTFAFLYRSSALQVDGQLTQTSSAAPPLFCLLDAAEIGRTGAIFSDTQACGPEPYRLPGAFGFRQTHAPARGPFPISGLRGPPSVRVYPNLVGPDPCPANAGFFPWIAPTFARGPGTSEVCQGAIEPWLKGHTTPTRKIRGCVEPACGHSGKE